MFDKDYEQLLKDFHDLTIEYSRLNEKCFYLKDLLERIRRFYPGSFEECATLDDLQNLED